MKITIESTSEIVEVDGAATRRWKGITEKGIPVDVFVRTLRVERMQDCSEFENELSELPLPTGGIIDILNLGE